ncbi:MAG: ArsR family transcriptional regulator [Saprospiraceae bacterium]|nr:ArsR family transcriptional regulator [Saprospiraceae bacterium]MBP7699029.1 ArsR family transcriptional regulator [Saprospiraceae bacterium]
MIETLISSKTRIKLLLKFFLNSNTTSYLRSLEGEFGESTNAIRVELNHLEKAGMLISHADGNRKLFKANIQHPLFDEIHSIIRKYIGLDRVIENVIERLGDVEKVYLIGDFAQGLNSQIIDLIIIGNVDKSYLIKLITKVEELIHRKVRYLTYTQPEAKQDDISRSYPEAFLLWSNIQ